MNTLADSNFDILGHRNRFTVLVSYTFNLSKIPNYQITQFCFDFKTNEHAISNTTDHSNSISPAQDFEKVLKSDVQTALTVQQKLQWCQCGLQKPKRTASLWRMVLSSAPFWKSDTKKPTAVQTPLSKWWIDWKTSRSTKKKRSTNNSSSWGSVVCGAILGTTAESESVII